MARQRRVASQPEVGRRQQRRLIGGVDRQIGRRVPQDPQQDPTGEVVEHRGPRAVQGRGRGLVGGVDEHPEVDDRGAGESHRGGDDDQRARVHDRPDRHRQERHPRQGDAEVARLVRRAGAECGQVGRRQEHRQPHRQPHDRPGRRPGEPCHHGERHGHDQQPHRGRRPVVGDGERRQAVAQQSCPQLHPRHGEGLGLVALAGERLAQPRLAGDEDHPAGGDGAEALQRRPASRDRQQVDGAHEAQSRDQHPERVQGQHAHGRPRRQRDQMPGACISAAVAVANP